MRSKFYLTMALLGLLGAQFSYAQDGLGKKSGSPKSSGSSSQSKGAPSRTSSGVRSDPGPRGGSSARTSPPVQLRGGGSSGSRGQSGNPGLGKRDSGSGSVFGGSSSSRGQSNGSGSVLGRPDRTNGGQVGGGNSGLGKSNGSGSVLGRPDRTSGGNSGNGGLGKSNGSGSVLGRPDRTNGGNSGNSGLGKSNGSGSVLGRPDRTNGGQVGGGNSGPGKSNGSGSVLGRPDRGNSGQVGGGNSGLGKGQGGGTVLGRPDRGNSGQVGGSDALGKRNNGNIGAGNSGSHNGFGVIKPTTVRNVPNVGSNNRILREVNRENRVHVGDNRYRNGYWAYNRGWCDNDFFFGHYGYAWYDGCHYVPSPFYWYYHVPPYLDCTRVTIGPITWVSCSTRYQWYAPAYDNLGYYDRNRGSQLDSAVDNIRRAFDRQSMRYLEDMVPVRGRIEIETGNGEGYSLNGEDFAQMLRDLVETTSTIDYRILDVYRDGDRATVTAEHRYRDSWGDERCVRHTYGLRACRGGYEITYFRSEAR